MVLFSNTCVLKVGPWETGQRQFVWDEAPVKFVVAHRHHDGYVQRYDLAQAPRRHAAHLRKCRRDDNRTDVISDRDLLHWSDVGMDI